MICFISVLIGHRISSHHAELNMLNDTFLFFAHNTFSHVSYLKVLPKILACSRHSRLRLKVSLLLSHSSIWLLVLTHFFSWYFLSSKRPCIVLLTVHLLRFVNSVWKGSWSISFKSQTESILRTQWTWPVNWHSSQDLILSFVNIQEADLKFCLEICRFYSQKKKKIVNSDIPFLPITLLWIV